jgi:lipopolysaccharide export system permease protein
MKVLARYLSKEVLSMTALVLLALVLLFSLVDLIQELDDLGRGNYTLARAFGYIALLIPGYVYETLPIAALIGTLGALAVLSNNSEVTVMRTAGMSLTAFGGVLVALGLGFALVSFFCGEVLVPVTQKYAQRFRLEARNAVVGQQFRSGLWVKDDKRFINVQEMMPDASLRNVRIFEFDKNFHLSRIQIAQQGKYAGENLWRLESVQQTQLQDGKIAISTQPQADWKTVLTPDLFGVMLVKPEQMSVWNLLTYIEHLSENRQRTTRYELALWFKFVYPLSAIVMMILAIPFVVFQRRGATVGGRIFLGIMLGVGFHSLTRLTSNLAVINNWNPMLASLAPAMMFLLLAFVLNYLVERR